MLRGKLRIGLVSRIVQRCVSLLLKAGNQGFIALVRGIFKGSAVGFGLVRRDDTGLAVGTNRGGIRLLRLSTCCSLVIFCFLW